MRATTSRSSVSCSAKATGGSPTSDQKELGGSRIRESYVGSTAWESPGPEMRIDLVSFPPRRHGRSTWRPIGGLSALLLFLLLAGSTPVVANHPGSPAVPHAGAQYWPQAPAVGPQTTPPPLLPFPAGPNPVDTLVLSNDTLVQGNDQPASGIFPSVAVNDTLNGYVYIGDNNAITVFDPTSESIVTTISDPGAPTSLAFDPANGNIYADDVDTNQVSVVNGSTNVVEATVDVGSLPVADAVDPSNGNIYVACAWSDSVSVLSGSNNSLIANLSVGSYPEILAVNGANGEVFVGNIGGTNVSVISPTNETAYASIAVGGAPAAEMYDAATGDIYVPVGSKVQVVNGTTNMITSTFATGTGTRSGAIDPRSGDLYIPCFSSSNITVYSPTKGKVVSNIPLFTRPELVAYDPINGDLYITEQPPAITPPHFQVVSTSSNTVIANISGGEYLFCVFVGGTSGTVFVADDGLNDIEVVSPKTNTVVKTIPLAYYPVQVTADPMNGDLYVGDEETSQVTAISDQSATIVHSWQIGTGPSEVAYDPSNGDVYIADYGSSTLTVISGQNNSVVATIRTGSGPEALAVDPVNGYVYVANVNSENLTVVNGSTNRITATIDIGGNDFPWELAVDNKSGNVYVGIGQTGVTVVSGKTNRILTNISVGPAYSTGTWSGGDPPLGMAYDPATDDIYVVAFYFNDLTVISGGNNSVIAVDPVGSSPEWASVGASGQYVYVSNQGSANVSVVNSSTNAVVGTIPVGSGPGPVLDYPARGDLFVANSASANITLVNSSSRRVVASIPVGAGADSFAVGPTSGDVWVANGGQGTMSILAASSYAVDFNETGLPGGSQWAVTLEGLTLTSNQTSVRFGAPNGTAYSFSIPGLSGYTWSPTDGELNVSGMNVTINVTFRATPDRYLLSLSEVGLPVGESWTATINGSSAGRTTGTTIGFSLLNATGYTFQIGAGDNLVATPSNGSFDIRGASVQIDVEFGSLFEVSFNERGLPAGQNWTAYLNRAGATSGNATISFWEPNGTYNWSIHPIAGFITSWSGTISISGSSQSSEVRFVQATYRIEFSESGLGLGTPWNLTISSNRTGSNATSILVWEPNGTFSWSVVPIPGYTTNWSSSLVVSGSPEFVNLTFTRVNYTLLFAESGLPQGAAWTVSIGSTARSSSTPYIDFVEPNGSFAWEVSPIEGYTTSWGGLTEIQGAPGSVNVSFQAVNYSVTFGETGLPTGTVWNVSLNRTTLTTSSATLVFSLPNGTYDWSVQPVAGFTTRWNGSVGVDGGTQFVPVPFSPAYAVMFMESGLPAGAAWWVNITGSTDEMTSGSSISVQLPNGTYGYSITSESKTYAGGGGRVSVRGAPVQVPVVFTLVTFPITFTQSGLPSGTTWWLNISEEPSVVGTGTTHSVALPNGSYTYTVASSNRSYYAAGGSLQVAGEAHGLTLTFVRMTFDVAFRQSGLPAGTNWSIDLDGVTLVASGTITFSGLSNGTYPYSVGPVDSFATTDSGSNLTVDGSSLNVTVSFVHLPDSASSTPAPWVDYTLVGILVVVLAVGGALFWRRRRQTSGRGETQSTSEDAAAERAHEA
jgi:YVTN family beta-propeller protein